MNPHMKITNAGDLKVTYMLAFDSFAISPGDIVDSSEGRVNMRYAREMLGVLANANLLVLVEDGEGSEAWQVANPGTYDNATREEAEATIEAWLANQNTIEPGDKPAKTKKDKTMTKDTPAEVGPCYCGCGGDRSAKSFYRPGHDARHAGQIGRQIAANYTVKGFDRRELLNELPSERLMAKAEAIAGKAIEKMDAKAMRDAERAKNATNKAKTEPSVAPEDDGTEAKEHGTVKVGKEEYVAVRYTATGEVEYFKGADTKVASKTAAKTFQADA